MKPSCRLLIMLLLMPLAMGFRSDGPADIQTLRLTMEGQGCNSAPTPCLQRDYVLTASIDGQPDLVFTGTLDLNGEARMVVPTWSRAMNWRLKCDGWLAQREINGPDGPDFPIGWPALSGDVDGDNVVGATDFVIIRNAFGTDPPNPSYDARADLTRDDAVDAADYALMARNFGLGGP